MSYTCLICKKEFECENIKNIEECPNCYTKFAKNKEINFLDTKKYNSILKLKNNIVLFKGAEHQEPVFVILKGFNKYGWLVFDVINENKTIFGDCNSFYKYNEKNLKIFNQLKKEYKINQLKKQIQFLEEENN